MLPSKQQNSSNNNPNFSSNLPSSIEEEEKEEREEERMIGDNISERETVPTERTVGRVIMVGTETCAV